MKSFIVFALFVAAAVAVPLSESTYAKILGQSSDNIGTGPHRSSFESDDGTKVQVEGNLENAGTPEEAAIVRGSYQYVAPDGVTYSVSYTADRYGFHPEAAHIPK